ncbi:MAG: glycosyltransferase family 4 protein [Candidatus Verstraetearchaeota archaeon]|nr:glycosyltransferase family 4 protein [Candidatus Verstraetearchaeota archaeon]
MNKIVMVVSSASKHDPRVYREAKSLIERGFNLTVYAWDRKCSHPTSELKEGIFFELFQVKLRHRNLFEFSIGLVMFWLYAFLKVLMQNVSVIHCHDFDTVPVGILVKLFKHNVKIIYDAHEIYPEMVKAEIPYALYVLLRWIDKVFTRIADCVIVPSEERKKFYSGAKRVIVVPNVSKFVDIPTNREDKKRDFIIFYGGGLSESTGILLMIRAVLHIPGVKLVLAGDGPLKNAIQKISKKSDKILYLGVIPYQKLLENLASADATFVFYSPTNLNNIYSASNKFFDAMMMGVPIIVNEESIHSRIVKKYNCGLVVPYGNIRSLENAILKLKNDATLRERFGKNGRRAFKENFEWDLYEKELIKCYQELLTERLRVKRYVS